MKLEPEEDAQSRQDFDVSGAAERRVQHLPFDIDFDGEARIGDFFQTTIRKAEEKSGTPYCNASFRGRLLNGKEIKLPEDFQGVILKKGKVEGKFSSMTCWNLDSIPTPEDAVNQVVDWTQFSAALHEPVQPPDHE